MSFTAKKHFFLASERHSVESFITLHETRFQFFNISEKAKKKTESKLCDISVEHALNWISSYRWISVFIVKKNHLLMLLCSCESSWLVGIASTVFVHQHVNENCIVCLLCGQTLTRAIIIFECPLKHEW